MHLMYTPVSQSLCTFSDTPVPHNMCASHTPLSPHNMCTFKPYVAQCVHVILIFSHSMCTLCTFFHNVYIITPFFSQVVLVIHISSTNVDILPSPFHKLCTLYTASFSKPAHGRRTCFSQPVHFICTICARYTQQNASAYTVAATSSKTTTAAHSLTDISLFCPQAIQTIRAIKQAKINRAYT